MIQSANMILQFLVSLLLTIGVIVHPIPNSEMLGSGKNAKQTIETVVMVPSGQQTMPPTSNKRKPTPTMAPTPTRIPTPTPKPTIAPTATPTALPTATPTPRPTIAPTATPKPTPSPTPTPSLGISSITVQECSVGSSCYGTITNVRVQGYGFASDSRIRLTQIFSAATIYGHYVGGDGKTYILTDFSVLPHCQNFYVTLYGSTGTVTAAKSITSMCP